MPKNKTQEEQAEAVTPEQERQEENCKPGELDELKDRYLRLMAEYDNFRKRSQREREALYADVRAETVKRLLPVLDNLERAAAAPCQDAEYQKGIEMTLKQCMELLAGLGLEIIEADGATFNPNLHDGVMRVEDESKGEQEIVEVFQTGYKIGDKILRHSVVKVAN